MLFPGKESKLSGLKTLVIAQRLWRHHPSGSSWAFACNLTDQFNNDSYLLHGGRWLEGCVTLRRQPANDRPLMHCLMGPSHTQRILLLNGFIHFYKCPPLQMNIWNTWFLVFLCDSDIWCTLKLFLLRQMNQDLLFYFCILQFVLLFSLLRYIRGQNWCMMCVNRQNQFLKSTI